MVQGDFRSVWKEPFGGEVEPFFRGLVFLDEAADFPKDGCGLVVGAIVWCRRFGEDVWLGFAEADFLRKRSREEIAASGKAELGGDPFEGLGGERLGLGEKGDDSGSDVTGFSEV